MAQIELSGVSRRFGTTRAVQALDLSVRSGAFLSLLGPSGCGKTTVLRLIAGLERPDEGRIAIGGRTVAEQGTFVEPEDRGLGMVFQSYALWPHMSVRANVEFPLQVKGLSSPERRRQASEALEMVGLAGKADQRPHQLSGGQRQRVALARSLASRPPLILLDEPLANLDAHLRDSMQAEFRRIHRQSQTTFVFVTHDQGEAMALADEVAVMDGGRLQQIAEPGELYHRPASPMVARFIGHGRTLPVEVLERRADGRNGVRLAGRSFAAAGRAPVGPGWLCLRVRDLAAAQAGIEPDLRATVVDSRFENGGFLLTLAVEGLDEGIVQANSPVAVPLGQVKDFQITGGWVLPRETV